MSALPEEISAQSKKQKGFLILKPAHNKGEKFEKPIKVKHPVTFETLRSFSKHTHFYFDTLVYESIHEVIPRLAGMDEWMPLMGWHSDAVTDWVGPNKDGEYEYYMPRWKVEKNGRSALTITEPFGDQLILELDAVKMPGFNANNPVPAIEEYLAQNRINCDVTITLSASQKLDSDIAYIHIHGEFDKEYSLQARKIFAASMGTDTSIYNGINPVYTAPPVFRDSLFAKKDHPDPIDKRIWFIKGSKRKFAMPEVEQMEKNIKRHGKRIKRSGAGINACKVTYTSLDKACKDIQNQVCYHDAMLFVSSHYANKNSPLEDIKNRIIEQMEMVPEGERNDRWHERMVTDHIDSICESAIQFVEKNPADYKPTKFGGLTAMSEIQPEPIDWDILGYFYAERINLVAGDRGAGKSMFCAYLAAQYSTGGQWLNTQYKFPKKRVAWLTAEERVESEVIARLTVNEFDPSMVFKLDPFVQSKDGIRDFFDIIRDRDEIRRILKEGQIEVLVVDTAFSFGGEKSDTMNANYMRKIILEYNLIAEDCKCTIFAIIHINKSTSGSAINDISGSGQITAATRGALFLIKDDDTQEIYIGPVKSNYADTRTTSKFIYEYEYVDFDPDTKFGKLLPSLFPVTMTVDEVIASNQKRKRDQLKEGGKARSQDEAQLLICQIMQETKDWMSWAEIHNDVIKKCERRKERKPNDNRLTQGFKLLKSTGLVDIGTAEDGHRNRFRANALTKQLVEEGTGAIE